MPDGSVIGGSAVGRTVCSGAPANGAGTWIAQAIRVHGRLVVAAISAFVVLGFVLRLLAARHDLWLDEIWSLNLVRPLSSPDQVFWRISHDNNHFLNSLWLYALGPGREPMLYRLPAVLMGTLSVLAAARIGLRRNAATGIAAAALVSTSTLLVNYGSEARGYAGLILALLVATDAFERRCASRADGAPAEVGQQRWVFGIAIGVGALFHLTMVAALPLFGAAALLGARGAGSTWGAALAEMLTLLFPSLMLLVPAVAFVIGGMAANGGLTVGGVSPFSPEHALDGIGTALRLASGLPEAVPAWLAWAACGLGVATASLLWLGPAHRWLAICGVVLLPCGLLALSLPNLEFPRYFLIPATLFILILADVAGAFWDRGSRSSRLAAGAMIAAILLGQTASLFTLITLGRGSYSAVLQLMTSSEEAAYTSDARFRVQTVLDFIAARDHRAMAYAGPAEFCSVRPRWYVRTEQEPAAALPERIELGPASCRASFEKTATYPTSALSGMAWTVYRRAD